MVQQGLTSQSTHYRSFRRRFYGSHNPTNSVIALKDDSQLTTSRANPTRLSSLKGKEKEVSKKIIIYIAPRRPKTQRRLEDRELNQARSQPDTVDRPVRTACTIVHHYNSTHYCNTETVLGRVRGFCGSWGEVCCCSRSYQGSKNGFFEKPTQDFLLVVNRDHSSKLISFLRKLHFCVHVSDDTKTDRQTDRQTNRWTASMHKALYLQVES